MKIAILLTGHMRTFEKTHKTFFKNFAHKPSDIFISTWDTDGDKIGTGGLSHKVYTNKLNKKKLEDKICKIYKPQALEIEEFRDFSTEAKAIMRKNPSLKTMQEHNKSKYSEYNIEDYLKCILSQFYKTQKGYNLIKDPSAYDIIAKFRPDVMVKNKFQWESKLKEKVFVGGSGKKYFDGENLWGDMLIVGNPEVMGKICNSYEYLLELTKESKSLHCITTIHTVMRILERENIKNLFEIDKNKNSPFNNLKIER